MELSFDPKFTDLFRDTTHDEWSFDNNASGADLKIMKFNNDPYKKLSNIPGYASLPEFVKQKLGKSAIYSKSEVKGWNRIEFQNEQLINKFGSDVIYTPPDAKDAAFYKAMEEWFTTIPYDPSVSKDSSGDINSHPDQFQLDDTKSYGLTSSLLSVFGDK